MFLKEFLKPRSMAFLFLIIFCLGQVVAGFLSTALFAFLAYLGIAFPYTLFVTFLVAVYCVFSFYIIIRKSLSETPLARGCILSFLFIYFAASSLFFVLFSTLTPLTYCGSYLYWGIIDGVWSTHALEQGFDWFLRVLEQKINGGELQ